MKMMEVAMPAVTAEDFAASPSRDGHGFVRQGRLALAVLHDRPGSSRRNDHLDRSRRYPPQNDGRKAG
jgi:hypothetical protein